MVHDIRNTRALDIYNELTEYNIEVTDHDPWAAPNEVEQEYGMTNIKQFPPHNGDLAIIVAVAHDQFKIIEMQSHKETGPFIYYVKGIFDKQVVSSRL